MPVMTSSIGNSKDFNKAIWIRIVAALLFVPVLLAAVTFFLANETENALTQESRILYSGPDDIKEFIIQDTGIVLMPDIFETQKGIRDSLADIALEIEGNSAYLYFSYQNISSIIALERLTERLSLYSSISAEGSALAVYSDLGGIYYDEAGVGRYSLKGAFRQILAATAALFTFLLLAWGSLTNLSNKFSYITNGKTDVSGNFISACLFSLGYSALITAVIFFTAAYLITPLLPKGLENFVLIQNVGFLPAALLAGAMFGVSVCFLRKSIATVICGKREPVVLLSAKIMAFITLCLIILSLNAVSSNMSAGVYFLPIFNLHAVFKDAIIYGLEWGKLLKALGINIVFCVFCMYVSLKAYRGR